MKYPRILMPIAIAAVLLGSSAQATASNADDAKMNAFIDDLMQKMTVEERIGQLNLTVTGILTGTEANTDVTKKIAEGKAGGVLGLSGSEQVRIAQKIAVEQSRLKIPLIFGLDVIHGYKTTFPIPLALACSWDIPAIEEAARIAAREASRDGVCWTYSPMVDISHDARWGRVAEGAGEDPFLGSRIAEALVRGYQGDFSSDANIMACVKHFACYGAPEGGRDYHMADMSLWRMYNEYLPPYKAAVDAGAGSIMASFNGLNGIPSHGNRWLLTDLLRGQWGFNGFVVADYCGVREMVTHGLGDDQQVGIRAITAGLDMDMVSEVYLNTLKKSLDEGRISINDINKACRRILVAKYRLGLFDDPYRFCHSADEVSRELYSDANRAAARRIAGETLVLLKNEGNLLPLKREGKIALIGPLADTGANMPGTWSVATALNDCRTLRDGFEKALAGKATLLYAKGCNLYDDPQLEANGTVFGREIRDPRSAEELEREALKIAKKADVIVAAMGEASEMSGEAASRTSLELPESQRRLLTKLLALGKPVVMLNFSGRPVVLDWENRNVPAILQVWFAGTEAADAIPDVVFGDVVPSGKLTMSFPRNDGQVPICYNTYNTGRPNNKEGGYFDKYTSGYLDTSIYPLFPFGYGLSYTTFEYSPVKLSASSMNYDGTITASVTVTNTGNYDADEVVQMYIHDVYRSVLPPLKELKGFKRISLKKGESRKVEFTIDVELLKFYNAQLHHVAEPGEFEVMVGPNSTDLSIAKFTLNR